MGAYLSTPVKDKHCEHGNGTSDTGRELTWAVVEMQGWRKSMEDAFVAESSIPMLDGTNGSQAQAQAQVFGVFDGHGGSEVALFCKRHLVPVLMDTEGWKAGEIGTGLIQAFHGMDVMIDDVKYRDELMELAIEGSKRAKNPDSNVSTITTSDGVKDKDDSSLSSDASLTSNEADDDDNSSGKSSSKFTRKISATDAIELFHKLLYMGTGKRMNRIPTAGIPTKVEPSQNEIDGENIVSNDDDSSNAEIEDRICSKADTDTSTSNDIVVVDSSETLGDQTVLAPESSQTLDVKSTQLYMKSLDLASTPRIPQRQICTLDDHPIHAGCTSVVAVLLGDKVFVANAGDSRCVLSRAGGVAEPLSVDHKPSQKRETDRIIAAGGFVNQFGRINGNLNLSRSIGDLKYKQNKELPPSEQIITAEPDIVSVTLADDDEFIIIGCDGIWDCLSNEAAVAYVRERIETKPTPEILKDMLESIISDDPKVSQGIGGDNMTALIIDLQASKRSYNIRSDNNRE